MCLFLNEIIFQNHYQSFFFIIIFLIILNNNLKFIYIQKTSNNITNKLKKKKKSFIDSPSNEDDDEEKFKKILKIILYIIILILGGVFFYYYIYIFNISENFTIETALEQLKNLLPEERYKQISVVVFEMIERPDKLGKGIHLLHIIKTLLKEDFPKNFEKIMNDIIKYFEEKK